LIKKKKRSKMYVSASLNANLNSFCLLLFTQEENGLERSRVEVMTPRPAGNVPS
jgi:hypothetical protein